MVHGTVRHGFLPRNSSHAWNLRCHCSMHHREPKSEIDDTRGSIPAEGFLYHSSARARILGQARAGGHAGVTARRPRSCGRACRRHSVSRRCAVELNTIVHCRFNCHHGAWPSWPSPRSCAHVCANVRALRPAGCSRAPCSLWLQPARPCRWSRC
jgi:hypothetical protein